MDILLIEDNAGDAGFIRERLGEAPDFAWRITHVDRLDRGIDQLSAGRFDLCMLNLNLPDSGSDTTLAQLTRFFELPVIVLTGLDDSEKGIAALQRGAQDYLVKGNLGPAELSRAIRYALERFKLEQRLGQVFNHASDAIFIFDPHEDRLVDINPKAVTLLGQGRDALLGQPMSSLVTGESWAAYVAGLLERHRADTATFALRTTGDRLVQVEVNAAVVLEDGWPQIIAIMRDVTERKQLLQDLDFYANYDPLTELPNRRSLEKEAKRFLAAQSRRGNVQGGLILLDLNNFKRINDALGQRAGDTLLAQVSARLSQVVRPVDHLVRLGGDEFAILVHSRQDYLVSQIAEGVENSFRRPFQIEGQTVAVGVSVGVALGGGVDNVAEWLRRADQAMYQAKTEGGGVAFYSDGINARLQDWLWTEQALKAALAEHALELYFQPLPHLGHSEERHAEVLLRWFHPERGPISPGKFIPVAEGAGLITALDLWVLAQALPRAQAGDLTLTVNVSPQARGPRLCKAGQGSFGCHEGRAQAPYRRSDRARPGSTRDDPARVAGA